MSLAMLLPEWAQIFLVDFIGKDCFQSLIVELDIEPICSKLLLSKVLGLGLVAGGMFVKVPQIQRIWSYRSAQGLSLLGNVLELFCYVVSLTYSILNKFPFSTFGETVFLTIQDFIIVALIMFFNGPRALIPVYFLLFAGLGFGLPMLPMDQLENLQWVCTFAIVISRLPQIVANFRNGNTGQLSAATVFMFAAGSSARIFTTLQEVNDPVVLAGYVMGTAVNLILAFQVAYYWNAKPAASKTAAVAKSSSSSSKSTKAAKDSPKASPKASPKIENAKAAPKAKAEAKAETPKPKAEVSKPKNNEPPKAKNETKTEGSKPKAVKGESSKPAPAPAKAAPTKGESSKPAAAAAAAPKQAAAAAAAPKQAAAAPKQAAAKAQTQAAQPKKKN